MLQELLLRNQVELVVIIAPASVCPQWKREMATRFGLGFELYNRAFVQRRRQDRGFGVNPWLTHARFVISYPTLRRPEYEAPLHAMLAEGERKTLPPFCPTTEAGRAAVSLFEDTVIDGCSRSTPSGPWPQPRPPT